MVVYEKLSLVSRYFILRSALKDLFSNKCKLVNLLCSILLSAGHN